MRKLQIGFMTNICNKEFYALFSLLEKCVKKHSTDNISLMQAKEKIEKHREKLLLLKNSKQRHNLTKVIQDEIKHRSEYLICLRMKIDAAHLSNIPEERTAAPRLRLWLDRYKKNLYKPTIELQGQLVKFLMDDKQNNNDVQEGITLLSLESLFKDIVSLTKSTDQKCLQRLKEKNHNAVKGKEIRQAAYEDLQMLFQTMEVVYKLSLDDTEKNQLKDLSNELKGIITAFHTQLKIRNTKNKNKKEVANAMNHLMKSQLKPIKLLPKTVARD